MRCLELVKDSIMLSMFAGSVETLDPTKFWFIKLCYLKLCNMLKNYLANFAQFGYCFSWILISKMYSVMRAMYWVPLPYKITIYIDLKPTCDSLAIYWKWTFAGYLIQYPGTVLVWVLIYLGLRSIDLPLYQFLEYLQSRI